MTKRSYYLLKDGKTITSEPPTVRYKSVARVANKKEAIKVFNARFEKKDGVYTERKPDTTPRRVSVIPSKPKAKTPKPGSKVCFCVEEDCGCPRAGEPESEQHIPMSASATRVLGRGAELGTPAELDEEQEGGLVASAVDVDTLLGLGPLTQTFHYREVEYQVPQGTRVTLTSKGVIILTPQVTAPEPPRENLTDLYMAGMRE
jgi:hypothetical protein